jgi:hypothetical protein
MSGRRTFVMTDPAVAEKEFQMRRAGLMPGTKTPTGHSSVT